MSTAAAVAPTTSAGRAAQGEGVARPAVTDDNALNGLQP